MSVPIQITDHTEQSYERLLGQFKDKPIIQAILQTWTDQIQVLENDLYDLMTKTLFLNAEGTNLERYGQLFGIPFPEGMADSEYRELLIAEIMRRSSDGTPDRIRQILEAATGMYGTQIVEHYNVDQKPTVMGSHMVWGYLPSSSDFTLTNETREARYLKWASPITTGGCVLGAHIASESSLFIPAELITSPLSELYISSNKTTNPTFDIDLSGWTYDPTYVEYERTFTDPTGDHHDGWMKVSVPGTTTTISQVISDQMNPESLYTAQVQQYQAGGYEGVLRITPYLWLMYFSNTNSTYITIPTWQASTGDTISFYATWDGTTTGDSQYLMDSDTIISNRAFFSRQPAGYLEFNDEVMRVWADGVEIFNELTPPIANQETFYEIEFIDSTNIAEIGRVYSTSPNPRPWNGNIRDFSMTSSTDTRYYTISVDSIPVPTDTIAVDSVGGQDGTINSPTYNRQTYEEVSIFGDELGTLQFSGASAFDLEIIVNPDTDPAGSYYYDSVEVYTIPSSDDLDFLVDEVDDNIAIRESGTEGSYATGVRNAVLAEFENQIERFQVETSLTPNDYAPAEGSTFGIDDFNVDTDLGIEEFNVEFREDDRPSNNAGIFIEISQIHRTENVNV